MSNPDWSKAPKGADLYANNKFWRSTNEGFGYDCGSKWARSKITYDMLKSFWDFEQRPTELTIDWPEEDRIQNIGQNGGDGLHYDKERETEETKRQVREHSERLRDVYLKEEQHEKPASDASPLGKYDRRIKGKYATGTCTVDVYRVLSAFEIAEPELQHCIKKLLAAGQRGAKDYQQDLKEAAVSLGMLIDRLQE